MPRHPLLLTLGAGLALTVVLHGCATAPSDAEVTAKAAATLKSSFKEQGQAKLDRLVLKKRLDDIGHAPGARPCPIGGTPGLGRPDDNA